MSHGFDCSSTWHACAIPDRQEHLTSRRLAELLVSVAANDKGLFISEIRQSGILGSNIIQQARDLPPFSLYYAVIDRHHLSNRDGGELRIRIR